MSWIFGSSKASKSQLPPTTALQQQKIKQIDSLRTFHNITEVQRDVEYRVTFNTGNATVFLNITLPPQFPNERPVVKAAPPMLHPWVNDQMVVVGCHAINSFYMHSNLGRAVMDIVKEFSEHPPQLLGSQTSQPPFTTNPSSFQPSNHNSFAGFQPMFTPQSTAAPSTPPLNPSLSQYAPPLATGSMTGMSHLSLNTQNTQTSPSRPPPIPPRPSVTTKPASSYPELDSLGLEELKDLNDKPEVMDVFLTKLESLKKLGTDKEEAMIKNEEIARYNLSLQSKLEGSKDELLKMCERLSELKQDFAKRSQKQQELTEVLSLSSIRTQIEIAAVEAEEQSEVIADDFLSKKIPLEEFIQRFLEKRKLCHSRRAKEEKIRHLHTRY